MNKKVCFAAAATLLAAMPAMAQRPGLAAASSARAHGVAHGRAFFAGRNLLLRGACRVRSRRCFADRFGRGIGLIGYGDGGLVDDPESLRDQGFFADTAESRAENGHAVYDYDRGYPYDWYRDPTPAAAEDEPRLAPPPTIRCEISWVAGARGAQAAVRVCRGRR
ncbi:MAG TPA: hypothetical protein VFW19_02350 [Allosphingosinicella sp.]|nr:hypothetical protein [Allosphingosinicella sp.]